MKAIFKCTDKLLTTVRSDLVRPHEFAAERVGFLSCRFGSLPNGGFVILACGYHPVEDTDYIDDQAYGALIGPSAIRKALQHTYNYAVGMFHVHMHAHRDKPGLSTIDKNEMAKLVPNFFNARNTVPHGALVLSVDSACGFFWLPNRPLPAPITKIVAVGAPMTIIGEK